MALEPHFDLVTEQWKVRLTDWNGIKAQPTIGEILRHRFTFWWFSASYCELLLLLWLRPFPAIRLIWHRGVAENWGNYLTIIRCLSDSYSLAAKAGKEAVIQLLLYLINTCHSLVKMYYLTPWFWNMSTHCTCQLFKLTSFHLWIMPWKYILLSFRVYTLYGQTFWWSHSDWFWLHRPGDS